MCRESGGAVLQQTLVELGIGGALGADHQHPRLGVQPKLVADGGVGVTMWWTSMLGISGACGIR